MWCKRSFSTCSILKERNNTWKLPEIKLPKESSSTKNQDKPRGLNFAALNHGPAISKNWRSLNLPDWKRQKLALKEKFGEEGWNPRKKLSRETIDQIKVIRENYPEYNSKVLAEAFNMSPEAMRRIVKSKFKPSPEESQRILERWKRRGERHLKYKLVDQITEKFVKEKQESLADNEYLNLESVDELRRKVAKKLTGKEDLLKP